MEKDNKLDVLVFAAHPDDVELTCSGTVISLIQAGKSVGIVDLTRGEMGTRGTPEIRDAESGKASQIMGIHARENLQLPDVFFEDNLANQVKVAAKVRKYRPDIVLCNAVSDRHPDHGKGSSLVSKGCFIAGLRKIETHGDNGNKQEAFRPRVVYHYIQTYMHTPDFIVDVSPFWEQRMESVKAFKSQFYDPNSNEPETILTSPDFLKFIEARAREWGQAIGVKYGEGFTTERTTGVKNIFDLI
jgi:N-acetylglucosamine malate deacetylase 1